MKANPPPPFFSAKGTGRLRRAGEDARRRASSQGAVGMHVDTAFGGQFCRRSGTTDQTHTRGRSHPLPGRDSLRDPERAANDPLVRTPTTGPFMPSEKNRTEGARCPQTRHQTHKLWGWGAGTYKR